jgi:DNA-binding response OmpR family regulator
MIVEDSLTVRRMLTQAIAQQTGLEIDAFDTLEGARDCHGEDYVVALVDLTLPDAPGGEAVNVLRERGLPVVILTADISEEKREAWLEAGVLDYVMKDSRHSLQYAVGLVHRLYLNQAIEVLVVDDSRTSRHRTAAQLRKQLLQVHEANSARDALAQLEAPRHTPDAGGLLHAGDRRHQPGANAARALQQAAARHHRHLGIGQTRPLGTLPQARGE